MDPGGVAHKNLSANAIARLRTCDEEPVTKKSKHASSRSEAVPMTTSSTPSKICAPEIALTPPVQQQSQNMCGANQSKGTNCAPVQSQGYPHNSPRVSPQRLLGEQCSKNSDSVVQRDGSQSLSSQDKYKEPLRKKDEAACKPKKSNNRNDASVSDAVSRSRHKSSSRHSRKEKESKEKEKIKSKEKVEKRGKHEGNEKRKEEQKGEKKKKKYEEEPTKKAASRKQDDNLPLRGAKTAPQEKASIKSASKSETLKSKSSESSKAKTGGIEESALFPPTFNKSFRIPKKVANLPNPLLSSDASSSKSSKITPTTWLQKKVSKPAAFAPKGATLNVEKLILSRGSDAGNKGEWRVDRRKSIENDDTARNSDSVKTLSALQSIKNSYSTDQEKSKEKRKEKSRSNNSKQPISVVENPPVVKDKTRKSRTTTRSDASGKKESKTRSSSKNSRKSGKKRRYSDNSDDWTPSGRRESRTPRRGRSRSSVHASSPENRVSGVASRTRSRTRSPSTRQTKSYTAAYSDSDESENDHEVFSSWDNKQIGDWLTEGDKTAPSSPSAPQSQNPDALSKSLKNCSLVNKKKKALLAKDVYTSLESVTLQALLSQVPNPTTPPRLGPESPVVESPPMPSLQAAAQESPAARSEMPNILPSPGNSGHSVSTPASQSVSTSERPSLFNSANKTTPSLITSACQPSPNPSLATCVAQLPPIDARPPLAKSACQPPDKGATDEIFVLDSDEHLSHQAELIDLEEESPFNINASFTELWQGIKAEQRNKFETLECCLANAIDEINCFTSRYRDIEKKPSKDWRQREIAVLRENFKNSFNRSWVTICDSIERLAFDYTEKEIFTVLTKKIGANIDYLSDPQGAYLDMRYLHELLNSKTMLELPRNCGTCVTVAAKLFTLHQKSKIYNLASVNPPLSVGGITPLRTVADSTVETAESLTSSGVLEPETNATESTSFVEFEDDTELRSSKESVSEDEGEERGEDDDNFLKCHVCQDKATIQCSRCLCAVYCDVPCQTHHWSNGHEKECSETLLPNQPSS